MTAIAHSVHGVEAISAADPPPNGNMGLRGLWALVANSSAMVVIAVSMLLVMFAAWNMHTNGMQTMREMNEWNVRFLSNVIERNTAALDSLAKEIHALRNGKIDEIDPEGEAMGFPRHEDDYDPNDSAWRDRTNRCPADIKLREATPPFLIVSRPRTGPTIWKRKNKRGTFTEFTHDEACAIVTCGFAIETAA